MTGVVGRRRPQPPQASTAITRAAFIRRNLLGIIAWQVGGLLLGIAVWMGTIASIDRDRDGVQSEALIKSGAVAREYALFVERTLEHLDQAVLLPLKEVIERTGAVPGDARMREYATARIPQVRLVAIVDRDAHPRVLMGDVNDTPELGGAYFRFHQNDAANVLLVSLAGAAGQTPGSRVLVTRRLQARDGSFNGVVLVAVDPELLTAFYAGSDPLNNSLLAVVGLDGLLRAASIGRAPSTSPDLLFRNMPLFDTRAGAQALAGADWFADGRSRYVGWQAVNGHPLVAVAGLDIEAVVAPRRDVWRAKRELAAVATLLIAMLAAAGTVWRARRVVRQWREEQARRDYRAATEGSNEGFLTLRAVDGPAGAIVDYEIVDCNERAAVLFGTDRTQLIGTCIATAYSVAYASELRRIFGRGMALGIYEEELHLPAETRLVGIEWVKIRALRAEGGVALNVQDISVQKRAQAQQQLAASVLENASDGIAIVDTDGCIVSVNRAFTELTGLGEPQTLGRNLDELAATGYGPGFGAETITMARLYGHWRGEVWGQRPDGGRYCRRLAIATVRNEEGALTHFCAIVSDISAQKLAELELERVNAGLEERIAQRTRELEVANRELESFSYSVAHDLRAPLQTAGGFAALLDKMLDSRPEARQLIGRIQSSVQRMSRLIDDLLQFSRVSRQDIDARSVNLDELVAEIVETLRPAYPGTEIHVAPLGSVSGDPSMLRQVWVNLVSNALKYSSKTAAPRIEIGVHAGAQGREFYVKDNGAGFDMQQANRLFGVFQRLHGESEFPGTGIGLAIAHRIVERHGGHIRAQAAVGQGATFYFTIPGLPRGDGPVEAV